MGNDFFLTLALSLNLLCRAGELDKPVPLGFSVPQMEGQWPILL